MAAIDTNPQILSEAPAAAVEPAATEQEKVRLLSRIQKYSLVRGTRSVVQSVPGTVWATGIVSSVYEPLRHSFLLRYAMDTSDMILVGLLDQCDGALSGVLGTQQPETTEEPTGANEPEAQEAPEAGPSDVQSRLDEPANDGSFINRLGQNAREQFHYIVYDNEGGRFFAGPADLVFGGINRGVESFVSNHWPQTKFPENYNGEFAKSMMLLRTILHRDYAVEPASNQVADN
ncbi:hypothetical protein JA9_001715 [Meyerozyma sp. JA9]|nr:hypothetical protein JA9_001715 [Meyerozyma sp. JA9]